MIVDFHTHVFPRWLIQNREQYCSEDACFSLLYSNPKSKLATAEDLINHMDDTQIDKSVILNIGWLNDDICIRTNDYIIESIIRYPKRLIGFCSINPNNVDRALTELERCAMNGIKGVGEIRPDIQHVNLSNKVLMDSIVKIMVDKDLIFLLHSSEPVGHQYIGKGNVTPEVIYPFILGNPKLKIVCAHWGGGLPFYALMPDVRKALENTYFDTAASPYLYSGDIFNSVINILSVDKILFGSDYPLISPRKILNQIETLGLDFHDYNKIVGYNAIELLNLTTCLETNIE